MELQESMSGQSSSPISPQASRVDSATSCRGSEAVTSGIRVLVEPDYLAGHSRPFENQYIFQYQIRIRNESDETVTLRARHWRIIDEDGDTEEVQGDGVIGMQPTLAPGESFEYESYCPLPTRWGTMEGTYYFVRESDGERFEVAVARFYLVAPESAAAAVEA